MGKSFSIVRTVTLPPNGVGFDLVLSETRAVEVANIQARCVTFPTGGIRVGICAAPMNGFSREQMGNNTIFTQNNNVAKNTTSNPPGNIIDNGNDASGVSLAPVRMILGIQSRIAVPANGCIRLNSDNSESRSIQVEVRISGRTI